MQSKRLQTPPGGAPRRISEKRLKHSRPPFHVQAKPAYRPRIFRCFFFFPPSVFASPPLSPVYGTLSFLFAAFSLSLDYSRAISEKSASVSVLAATCHAHLNAGGKTATAAARMLTWVKKMKHKRGKSIAPNGSSRTTPGRFCPSRAATEGLLRN